MSEYHEKELTCVEPEVGEGILELRTPILDPDRRRLLEAHLEICDHCRLTMDLERRLAEAVRAETREPRHVSRRPWLGVSAGVALAASLVLMVLMPPRAVGPSLSMRGDDETGFQRPVEGEVVGPGDIAVSWKPVPGAESYGLRVVGARTGATWTGESSEAEIVIPASTDFPPDDTYRALLSTTPSDLLPPGRVSVSFSKGDVGEVVTHRLRRAQPIAYVLGLLGLGLGAAFAFVRRS